MIALQFLAPRFVAMRDALKDLPGVTIVADISPTTVNEEGGMAMMQTILLAHPNIDVVLGADTVVLGALRAVRAAGKARPDQFFGGIDGEPEAVAEIKSGGPYKVEHQPGVAHLRLRHGAARGRLARGQERTSGHGYSSEYPDVRQPGPLRGRYCRPSRSLCRRRTAKCISQDVREHLLRDGADYVNFPWSSERQ